MKNPTIRHKTGKMVVYNEYPWEWHADVLDEGSNLVVDLGDFPTWRQAFDAAYAWAEANR